LISFEEISEPLDCADRELRDRVGCSKKGPATTQYRAVCKAQELAFVALDRLPDFDALVIYELFVASQNRNQGHGARVLEAIEHLARREGFSRTVLIPHPFDREFPEERLMNWYKRRGYSPRADFPSEFEKVL
jgi:GNAT superfamily N-acetyltransferase